MRLTKRDVLPVQAMKLGIGAAKANLSSDKYDKAIGYLEDTARFATGFNLLAGLAAPLARKAPLNKLASTSGSAIVKYDPKFAAEQILGESWETTGGRTICPYAAQQMVKPPLGRVPMTKKEVDLVLDTATKVRKVTVKPEGDTVTVQRPDLPGKPRS